MLREKFALTERGAFEFKRGALFCALANIVMMAPIGALCMVTNDYLSHLINPSNPVPELGGYLVAIVIIVLLMLLAQWLEYNFTYNVYTARALESALSSLSYCASYPCLSLASVILQISLLLS